MIFCFYEVFFCVFSITFSLRQYNTDLEEIYKCFLINLEDFLFNCTVCRIICTRFSFVDFESLIIRTNDFVNDVFPFVPLPIKYKILVKREFYIEENSVGETEA